MARGELESNVGEVVAREHCSEDPPGGQFCSYAVDERVGVDLGADDVRTIDPHADAVANGSFGYVRRRRIPEVAPSPRCCRYQLVRM